MSNTNTTKKPKWTWVLRKDIQFLLHMLCKFDLSFSSLIIVLFLSHYFWQMCGDIIIFEPISISAEISCCHSIETDTDKKNQIKTEHLFLKLTEILLHILTIRKLNLSPYLQFKVMKIQIYSEEFLLLHPLTCCV